MNVSYLTSMHAVQKKRFNYHVCIIHNVGGGRTASKLLFGTKLQLWNFKAIFRFVDECLLCENYGHITWIIPLFQQRNPPCMN